MVGAGSFEDTGCPQGLSRAWARYSVRRSKLSSDDLSSSSTGHSRKDLCFCL